jgi:tRNA threonylcarbamoyladenosine biosynthesis protein TsaE
MSHLEITSRSPEETQKIGGRIGEVAQPGDMFLLVGQLGAGKTCLTQGIAWGLGIKEYAASPSFMLIRELYGRLPLYHIDFYRLDHLEEISYLSDTERNLKLKPSGKRYRQIAAELKQLNPEKEH